MYSMKDFAATVSFRTVLGGVADRSYLARLGHRWERWMSPPQRLCGPDGMLVAIERTRHSQGHQYYRDVIFD